MIVLPTSMRLPSSFVIALLLGATSAGPVASSGAMVSSLRARGRAPAGEVFSQTTVLAARLCGAAVTAARDAGIQASPTGERWLQQRLPLLQRLKSLRTFHRAESGRAHRMRYHWEWCVECPQWLLGESIKEVESVLCLSQRGLCGSRRRCRVQECLSQRKLPIRKSDHL